MNELLAASQFSALLTDIPGLTNIFRVHILLKIWVGKGHFNTFKYT